MGGIVGGTMVHERIFQEFQQLANSGCRGTSLMQIIANRLREAMVRAIG
jgi:hypothetical protein